MKTNLDSKFKTDSSKETDGVWYPLTPEVSFKLRRMGGKNSMRLKQYAATAYKPYAKQIEADVLSQEKSFEIACAMLVDVIIVDWKGVEADGQPLEFNRENAMNLLLGLPDLADKLSEFSNDKDNFIETVGN